jgi:hypothetical protein
MSERINYDGRRFRMASTSTGDTAAVGGTIFTYQQAGDLITCHYTGGSVREGRMMGLADATGKLTIRFMHIYTDGRMMSGDGETVPEVLPDGRLRLHETFTVFDDGQAGTSVVEEI